MRDGEVGEVMRRCDVFSVVRRQSLRGLGTSGGERTATLVSKAEDNIKIILVHMSDRSHKEAGQSDMEVAKMRVL